LHGKAKQCKAKQSLQSKAKTNAKAKKQASVLSGTVDAIGEAILPLWWEDAGWRASLRRLSLADDRE
jgi:hypothetical protein